MTTDTARAERDAAQAAFAAARAAAGGFHPTKYAAERSRYMLAQSEFSRISHAAARSAAP